MYIDLQSNGSEIESVDYSKLLHLCCVVQLENIPDNYEMSTASFHNSRDSSLSGNSSDEEDSTDEEIVETGNQIYEEADLHFACFLIQIQLALNEHHDVGLTAANYLKIFYTKFRAFKSSDLYSELCEEMADFKTEHKFESLSEILENTLEFRRIFIQNLFALRLCFDGCGNWELYQHHCVQNYDRFHGILG